MKMYRIRNKKTHKYFKTKKEKTAWAKKEDAKLDFFWENSSFSWKRNQNIKIDHITYCKEFELVEFELVENGTENIKY